MLCHAFLYQLLTVFGCDLVTQKQNNYCFFLGLYLRAKVSAALRFPVLSAHVGQLVNRVLVDNINQSLCVLYKKFVICPVYVLHIIYQYVADSTIPSVCRSGHLRVTKAENNLSRISWAFNQSLRLNG